MDFLEVECTLQVCTLYSKPIEKWSQTFKFISVSSVLSPMFHFVKIMMSNQTTPQAVS